MYLILFSLGLVWTYLMIRVVRRAIRSSDLEFKNQEHLELNERFKKVVDFSKNSGRIKEKNQTVENFLKE